MQEPCMSLGLKTEVYADEALSLASTLQHSLNGNLLGFVLLWCKRLFAAQVSGSAIDELINICDACTLQCVCVCACDPQRPACALCRNVWVLLQDKSSW